MNSPQSQAVRVFGIQLSNEQGKFVWTESYGQDIAGLLELVTSKILHFIPSSIQKSNSAYDINGKNIQTEEDDNTFMKAKVELDKKLEGIEQRYKNMVSTKDWFLYIKGYMKRLPLEFHPIRMHRAQEIGRYLVLLELLLSRIQVRGEGWIGKVEHRLQGTLPKDQTYLSYPHIRNLGNEFFYLSKEAE